MMGMDRNRSRSMNGNGTHAEAQNKKSRVVWTNEEMMILAQTTRSLRVNDPSLTPLEAVRLAQTQALPPHRRRTLDQTRQIEDVTKLIRDIAFQEEIAKAAGPKPAPAELLPEPDVVQSLASTGFEPAGIAAVLAPADAKAKRTLIRYTADERRTIARESKRLLAGFEDMSRLEAIRKAIEYTMPSDRQRSITTFDQVAWIADEWKTIEQQERAEKEAREAREQAAEAARIAEQSRIATEAARAEAEAAKAVDPASLPFDTLIGAIGVKVAGMLLHSIGEHLEESIMQRVTEALGHVAVNVPPVLPEGVTRLHAAPRNRKPRVLIVGLLNQQEQDMTKAMGELLSLDYVKSEHHKTLEDKARNADLVVLMTKFISHHHSETVQRVNEHVVFRNGGVSELKRWLTQWINGEVITAAA
jgi:hypothetical protein